MADEINRYYQLNEVIVLFGYTIGQKNDISTQRLTKPGGRRLQQLQQPNVFLISKCCVAGHSGAE